MDEKIKLGISACLLGEKVRYDGTGKLDPFLAGTLVRYVQYVPVCPEVEFGLGTPREPMRLAGEPADPRLVTINTGRDHTEGLKKWAAEKVHELEREGLCGFIFKARSPSCGLCVDVFDEHGQAVAEGAGLFAAALIRLLPELPVQDDDGMQDPALREGFMSRVFPKIPEDLA